MDQVDIELEQIGTTGHPTLHVYIGYSMRRLDIGSMLDTLCGIWTLHVGIRHSMHIGHSMCTLNSSSKLHIGHLMGTIIMQIECPICIPHVVLNVHIEWLISTRHVQCPHRKSNMLTTQRSQCLHGVSNIHMKYPKCC